ncbi:MAG TPA: outer membrane beta-barrel family protein [Chitinophagaceae bacterium]|nr:outer membrane beta-barrel family protein [Chitinophagaceae bacterium]
MKKSFLSIIGFLIASIMYAQMPGGMQGGMGGQNMNVGHFYGKIVDASTNKPLESVSVQLIQNKLDTATKKRKDVVVAGMLTDKKGDFSLENLPVLATFKLLITGIGYKTIEQKAVFELKMGGGMSQMLNAVDKDLGNIKLEVDTKQLAEVTVTGTKSMLQMGIDRKIFNVDKSLTSVGGTAVDVMKNVPSVNVDIDGNVTLRNAAPQIFVDGRPSTLTLEQIPADAIESVEIITNPSAKFDASGGGSGILNIVLKKNRKAGYSGNIRANIDSRLRFGVGGDVNVKQGKINFFGNAMYNQRKSIATASTTRKDYYGNGNTAFLSQNDRPVNEGFFAFGRAGFDYFVDNRNTFTLSGVLVRGEFSSEDKINIAIDSVVNSLPFNKTGIRNTEGSFNFRNYGSALSYKHNFAKAGKELTADGNFNYSKNNNLSFYESQYFKNNITEPLAMQKTIGGGVTKFFTAQSDYVDPITEKMKLEMGARMSVRNFNSSNDNLSFKNTAYVSDLSNHYKFNDKVYAGYVTFSQKIKNFTYQLGARVESSKYTGILIDSNKTFSNKYPFSFFPSVYLTQKINEKQNLQLNYSRKINRPNFFQLIPYFDFTDSLNISKGNPALIPEFTNLLELSYQADLNKGNNILATVYYRNTSNLITRYQYRDKNPNPFRNDSVFINTFVNATSSYAYGLEVTGKIKMTKWWDITANVNLYESKINGNNVLRTLENKQTSWFGKLNNAFKLPKNYSIQLTGDYQSKTILPANRSGGGGQGMMFGGGQLSTANGYTYPVYGADIAVRKDFLKNNVASLTLSVNDIFRTRIYKTHSEAGDIKSFVYSVQENERRRDPQMFRLSFNYRFGKFDVSLFKRKNLKGEQEGMQNGMQGIQQ